MNDPKDSATEATNDSNSDGALSDDDLAGVSGGTKKAPKPPPRKTGTSGPTDNWNTPGSGTTTPGASDDWNTPS